MYLGVHPTLGSINQTAPLVAGFPFFDCRLVAARSAFDRWHQSSSSSERRLRQPAHLSSGHTPPCRFNAFSGCKGSSACHITGEYRTNASHRDRRRLSRSIQLDHQRAVSRGSRETSPDMQSARPSARKDFSSVSLVAKAESRHRNNINGSFSIRRLWVKRLRAYPSRWYLMSIAGPRFSLGSAQRPSHHGIRRVRRSSLTRVLTANLLPTLDPLRTRLTHRPAKDIVPPAVDLFSFPVPIKLRLHRRATSGTRYRRSTFCA